MIFRKDNEILNLLSIPTIYLPKFSKYLTLHKFLYILESESLTGSEEDIQNKEFISWNVFKATLNNFVPKKYLTRLNNPLTEDEMVVDLKNEVKDVLVDVFCKLNRDDNNMNDNLKDNSIYFETREIVKMVQNSNRYHLINDSIVRIDERGNSETLKEILERISFIADQYIDLDEFLEFFTKRGQPVYFESNPSIRKTIIKQRIDNLEDNYKNESNFSYKKEKSPLRKDYSPEKVNISDNILYFIICKFELNLEFQIKNFQKDYYL